MSEDKNKLELVEGGKEYKPKERAKKLTTVQLEAKAKDARKVKKVIIMKLIPFRLQPLKRLLHKMHELSQHMFQQKRHLIL
mgnify:CR=1 FL=1